MRAWRPAPLAVLLGCVLANGARSQTAVPAFRVERLDGGVRAGHLHTLDEGQLVLDGAGGESIATADVLRIERLGPPPRRAGLGVAYLADGGRIVHRGVSCRQERFVLELPVTSGDPEERRLTLTADALQAVRLRAAASLDKDWGRLVAEATDTDLLVVYRNGGRKLRAAPCTIVALDGNEITVLLDGEPLAAPLDRVHGLVLAKGGRRRAAGAGGAVVKGSFGSIVASRVALSADRLRVDSGLGFSFLAPLDSLERIDFSPSRVRWLGELPLVQHEWLPAFGFPAGLRVEDRPPGLVVDRAFGGGPLTIANLEAFPRPGALQRFDRGVGLRSGSETVFKLPAGFNRFRAVAGIDPETARQGSVELRLFADDRIVFEHTVDGSAAVPIEATLGGAERLRIVVDYGGNLDLGDRLHLGSARVTK